MGDNTANHDLLAEWRKVVSEYEKVTQQSLSATAPSNRQDLEARCLDLSRSDRNELVKAAAVTVFNVAKFAVDASSIFPPASSVFMALSALSETIQHYRANFVPNKVLDQLQGIKACLGRMEGYLKICEDGIELDAKLREIIMEIFAVTLSLCTIYTKVAQDSKTPTGIAKNLLKATIRWDGNIKSRVQAIADASDREMNNNVAALRVSDIYTNDTKVRKANSEKLKRYFNIDGKELWWTGRQASLQDDRIQKMGDWLFDLPEFKSWTNIDRHTDTPVLYINAPISDPERVWTSFISSFVTDSKPESTKPQKVLFVVLDGYGGLDGQALQNIVEEVDDRYLRRRYQLRVLLSGNQEFSHSYYVSKIDLSRDYQRLDARIFIDEGLTGSYEHRDHKSEGYRMLWEIRKDLTFNFEGNYHDLKDCIREVERSSLRGLSELKELRGLGLKDQLVLTKRKLETLNNDLQSDDIEVLNQLIVCLVHWEVWPTVQELNAFLSLRLGSKFKPPIEDQLNSKFARLAWVEDGQVVARKLFEFFDQQEVQLKITRHEDEACNTHQSHEDNVLVPKSVLESLFMGRPANCITSDGFEHLIQAHTFGKATVHFSPKKVRLDTVRFLLQAISDNAKQERAETNDLLQWGGLWLPKHFSDVLAADLENLEPKEQEKLGKQIYNVFAVEQVVKTWLPKVDIDDFLWKNWEADLGHVHKWLCDHKSIRNGFNQKLDSTAESPGDLVVGLPAILNIPMKVVACEWLQGTKWEARNTFIFLAKMFLKAYESSDGYKVDGHQKQLCDTLRPGAPLASLEQEIQNFHTAIKGKDCSVERIECPDTVRAAEKWAMSILNSTEVQYQSNLRLAETFIELSDEESSAEAERRCELIKMDNSLDIKARLSLVHVLEIKRKKQALDEVMKIRHNIQRAGFRKADSDTWTKELDRFWKLCDSTNSAKEAFTACRDLAEEFPEEPFPLERARQWIMRETKLDPSFEIISLKRKLGPCSLLAELFYTNAQSEEFHRKFYVPAKDRQGLVLDTYNEAIRESKSQVDTVFLQYHYGMALYRRGKLHDAIESWEKSIDQFQETKDWNYSDEKIFKSFNMVAETLGSAYLEIVLDHSRSESPEPYITKLEQYTTQIGNKQKNIGVNYLALLLARAYQDVGKPQKAVSSVKNHMATAFDLLGDETEDNDWNGHFMLAEALMSLNDDDNARAAWSLIVNVPDAERTCDISITCSGGCGWAWEGSEHLQDDLHICRICPHARFEGDCRELLQKNGLEQDFCGSNHKFLKISRRKKKEVRMQKQDKVLVGKVEMKIEDWLDGLRCRYGIENPSAPWTSRTAESLQMAKWSTQRRIGTVLRTSGATRSRRKS
ncbi:hypothetical protein SLS54_008084 [Diplodia seriata]